MKRLLISLILTTSLSLFAQELTTDTLLFTRDYTTVLPLQVGVDYYDCVKYHSNRLIFPGDIIKFNRVYNQLDSLSLFGKGKMNIVHIGGSHVQADVFTNQLRTNFANIQESMVSDRGIIFPFSAAKTNNPQNYSISYEGTWTKVQNSRPPISSDLGITGYSITSNKSFSSISFNLNPHNNTLWQYKKLTLLYSIKNELYEPYLVINKDTIAGIQEGDVMIYNLHSYESTGKIILDLASKHNYYYTKYQESFSSINNIVDDNIIFSNDAINTENFEISLESDRGTTDYYTQDSIISETDSIPTYNDSIQVISNNVNDNDINFTIYGLLPTTNFAGITVHSLGVNGASLRSWLRCNLFEDQLQYIQPDLAILNIGINDANVPSKEFNAELFKQKYNELIALLYSNNPDCAIIFITNNDCILRLGRKTRYTNPNGKVVQKAIYELAQEHNAAVWDLYDIMGGYGSSKVWMNKGLINKDRIHFTINGYKLLGNLLYNSIIYDWMYKN